MSLEVINSPTYSSDSISDARLSRTPFQTSDKLLDKSIRDKLTNYAKRYYAFVWNVANWRSQTSVWIDESISCLRSGVKPEHLASVRQELIRERLIKFESGRPELRNGKARYEITDPDKVAADEWADIFPEPTD